MDMRPIPDYNNTNVLLQQSLPPHIDSLNRLASVIISLEPLKAPTAQSENQARLTGFVAQDTFSYLTITSNNIHRGALAKIEWRRKSGKVSYDTNGFYLDTNDNNNRIKVVPTSYFGIEKEDDMDNDEENNNDKKNDKDSTPDPTANLSFNLTLTDEQRKTKEKLVLPYLKAQQIEIDGTSSSSASTSTTTGGAIFYEPDAADDFDDEDPDDDLDI
ncbi:Elongator complex protein 5 [Cunninghamella echinulata]|nr:Elongator complex protein 5 [Cunninghamella echinulata]